MTTRRDFIQNMALGTGAFLLPNLAKGFGEPKKLGVARVCNPWKVVDPYPRFN